MDTYNKIEDFRFLPPLPLLLLPLLQPLLLLASAVASATAAAAAASAVASAAATAAAAFVWPWAPPGVVLSPAGIEGRAYRRKRKMGGPSSSAVAAGPRWPPQRLSLWAGAVGVAGIVARLHSR